MRAATGQTRNQAANPANARKVAPAFRAPIEKTPTALGSCKWQIMAALLIGDSQVVTSVVPLNAMGENPATPGAELREQVRQLMSKSTIDFAGMIVQSQI